MGLGTLTLMGMLWMPGQAPPSDVHVFNRPKMDIPIRYDPAKKDDIRELLLFISRDQGESWDKYAVASPVKDTSFPFTAPQDGVYWFQMMIVDKQGRGDPVDLKKAPVGLKVLIDTKPPTIAIKSFDRIGDEAAVSWEVVESNPDWSKFLIDYRIGDGLWTPTDAKGAAIGICRFRSASAGNLTVRIQAYDLAGNRAEMTKDLSAPANVAASSPATSVMRVGVPGEVAPPIVEPMSAPILPPTEPVVSPFKGVDKRTSSAIVPVPGNGETSIRNDVPGSPLAVSPPAASTIAGVPLPVPQIINVAKFDLAYDVESKGPSGVSKAEVWITRDDGRSWQKWSTTEKAESPVTVDLTKNNPHPEGIYGLKIVLLSGAGLSQGPPVSGDIPDMRVDVDLAPPVVKLYEPIADSNQKDTMIFRWQAVDRNLANDPITLEWAEQPEGPWNPIAVNDSAAVPIGASAAGTAKRLPNTGQYSWKVPANFPTHRVYVRVTARDTAGNVGEVRSPHPILVDMNKPVAKIHGIIGATPSNRR